MAIKTRVLDSYGNGSYLLQLKFDKTDVTLRPDQLMAEIRTSLAKKIAALLFEKIEPKILDALSEKNHG